MLLARALLICSLLAALAPPVVDAQPPPGRGRAMALRGDGDAPGALVPLLLRQPDLSDEQRDRIRAIMRKERATLRARFAELEQANEALAARLVAPGPLDAAALQPDLDRVAAARRKLMEHGLETALALRAVLTPEQLARAARARARLQELQREMNALLDGDVGMGRGVGEGPKP